MNYKPIYFTNDNGDVFNEAFYRLGHQYGYIFRDVVVKAENAPDKAAQIIMDMKWP
jgi:hypothetical protein